MNNLENYGLKNTENIWEWGVTHSNEFKSAIHENCSLLFDRLKSNLDETKNMPLDDIKKVLRQLKKSTKLLDRYYLIYLKFLASTNFTSLQKHPVIQACEHGGKLFNFIPNLLNINSQGLNSSDIDKILIKAIKFDKKEVIKAIENHKLIDRNKYNELYINSTIVRNSPFDLEELVESQSGKLSKLCTPEKLRRLNQNLEEVIKHHPKYILGNDFSVQNTYRFDWDPRQICSELNELQKKLLQIFILNVAAQRTLSSNIRTIVNYLKPKTPICLSIIIEKEKEWNEAMLECARVSIYKGLPTVMTMGVYESHPKKFDRLFKKKNLEVFYQEKGDKERVMLVLPKGKQAESLGFALSKEWDNDKNLLKPWLGKDVSDKKSKPKFNENLQQIFLSEQENQGFYRIIRASGHGGVSNDIVGLEGKKEFQEFLSVLKNHHTLFLSLFGCGLGGENSTRVGLPNGEIPFPIYMESSTEVYSYSPRVLKDFSIDDMNTIDLYKVRDLLFPELYASMNNEKPVYESPKSLSNKRISRCVKQPLYNEVRGALSNLGTIFLPTPGGVPKVAYLVCESPLVLDISNVLKKVRVLRSELNTIRKKFVIFDKEERKIAYLFSEPIIPATINIYEKTPKAFISRGGNSHHIINEIVATDLNIKDFGIATFNAFTREDNDYKNINKAFFIGKIKCQYNGKLTEVENVMININHNKRQMIFKLPDEENYRLIKFSKTLQAGLKNWVPQKEKNLSTNKAIFQIYKCAAISKPSSKALLQVTAGKVSDSDFYEALSKQFWGFNPPFEAQIYNALLNNSLIFRKEDNLDSEKYEKITLKQSSSFEELGEIVEKQKDKDYLVNNLVILWNIKNINFNKEEREEGNE